MSVCECTPDGDLRLVVLGSIDLAEFGSTRLTREGSLVTGLYIRVSYRTLHERWPLGGSMRFKKAERTLEIFKLKMAGRHYVNR